MLVEASFPAFFLQLLQSFSFPLLTSTMHTVIVKTIAVNKDKYHSQKRWMIPIFVKTDIPKTSPRYPTFCIFLVLF